MILRSIDVTMFVIADIYVYPVKLIDSYVIDRPRHTSLPEANSDPVSVYREDIEHLLHTPP